METDAKGQLGGLECSNVERERIAQVSGAWKCPMCEKSNREILAECEEAVKEKEKDGEKAEEVVEVPSELKMGWKDEMGNDKKTEEGAGQSEAELAEGFVRTTKDEPPTTSNTQSADSYPPARPAQSVPQPTGSQSTTQPLQTQPRAPQPPSSTYQVQQTQLAQRRSDTELPMWIDRAIAGVVILLAAMVLKVLIGV